MSGSIEPVTPTEPAEPIKPAEPAEPPTRQVRALFDDETVTVYQAYRAETALEALRSGSFSTGFSRARMTWIKPSFLWMMYRSGWGLKPGQEHVLAIRLRRDGFEAALGQATLSHHDPKLHATRAQWSRSLKRAPVRIQWDPERDVHLRALNHRAIQVGLSGTAVDDYCDAWITGIDDATGLAHQVHALVREQRHAEAHALLPDERPYPLPTELATAIGADK